MTAVNSFPRLHPMVDFPDGPWTYPATSWTDLATYVRDDQSVRIQRGRTNEFSRFQAGRMTNLVLDNRTRVFDPTFTSAAPFNGNIQPSKQLQLFAEYPWLPGQLPDGRLRNTTVGVGIGATVGYQATSAPAFDTTQGYITPNKSITTTISNAAGSPYVAFGPVAIVPGTPLMVAFKARCSRAGAQIQPAIQWFNAANALLSSTSPDSGAHTMTVAGTWYGVQTLSPSSTAPASTAWAFPVVTFPGAVNGDQWWFDAIVVDYAKAYLYQSLIYTYVDDWHLTYKGRDAICTVSSSDAFASFGVKDIVSTGYEQAVLALPSLRHYWSFGQPSSYTLSTLPEDGPNGGIAAIKYFAAFGVPGPVLTDLTTAVGLTDDQTLAIGGWFDLGALATPAAGVGWTIGFWFQMNTYTDRVFALGDANDPNSVVNPPGVSGAIQSLDLYTSQLPAYPGAMNCAAVWTNPASGTDSTSFSVALTPPKIKQLGPNGLWNGAYMAGNAWDGAWHFITISQASDKKTFSFMMDGQQITPTIIGGQGTLSGQNLLPLASGATTTMVFPAAEKALLGGSNDVPGFTGQIAHFFVMDAVITPAQHANLYNIAQQQWFGQTPGGRLAAVASVLGFPSALVNVDAGNSTLNAETTSLAQQNALSYMQYVEDSENAWMFMDALGELRLISRQNMIKPPGNVPSWTLGDLWPQVLTSELPIEDSTLDNSNTNIYTEAEGSRKGGDTLYIYGSQLNTQGKRTISLSNLLNASDQEVYNILNYRISQYQNPRLRITQVKIQPEGMDELWQFVLQVEIGNVVQINIRPEPAGSAPIHAIGRVQQIQHSIGRRKWETVLDLANVDVQQYMVLGDAVLGKLDSGNRLAY